MQHAIVLHCFAQSGCPHRASLTLGTAIRDSRPLGSAAHAWRGSETATNSVTCVRHTWVTRSKRTAKRSGPQNGTVSWECRMFGIAACDAADCFELSESECALLELSAIKIVRNVSVLSYLLSYRTDLYQTHGLDSLSETAIR